VREPVRSRFAGWVKSRHDGCKGGYGAVLEVDPETFDLTM
jgi:hypothetical protein